MSGYPKYSACTCGRYYYCGSLESERSTKSMCAWKHVQESSLLLPAGRLTARTALFVIATHSGKAPEKQRIKLQKQLQELGIPPQNIFSSCGFNQANYDYRGGRLRNNQCTHYSARFKWFPNVSRYLQESPGKFRAVYYLEYSANSDIKELDKLLNPPGLPTDCDIAWLGFRKIHAPSQFMSKHDKVVIEGSKCLRFTKNGLQKIWQVTRTQRFSHYDLMLCRHMPGNAFWRPSQSLFGTRAHMSVPNGGTRRKALEAKDTYYPKRTKFT